jgi:hypothetical protein
MKKDTFEQRLRKAGKWIGPGHEDDDTRVLDNIPPSKFHRLLVMCKRCERVSVLWAGDYRDGKSKCSYGCFRGRPRRSALPELPAPKKKEKTKKQSGKSVSDWSFGEDKTSDWWTFEEDQG